MDVTYKALDRKQWRAVWKEHWSHVVVNKYSPFATCEECAKFVRALQEKLSMAERAKLRAVQDQHIAFVRAERHTYHETRFQAKQPENRKTMLSMIIDGMDQSKTYLPYVFPLSKALAGLLRLKTHITGVLMHGQLLSRLLFVDFSDIPHDPNLVCHVILQSLLALDQIPPILYLQLDNTTRENENWVILTFLAVLILHGTFQTAQVRFLLVGHTHEDIDGVFGVIATMLKKSIVTTIGKLWRLLLSAFKTETKVVLVQEIANVREWLLPVKPRMKDITSARCFKLRLADDGVRIQAKATLSEDAANFMPEGGMVLLRKPPEGEPCKVPLRPSQLEKFATTIDKQRAEGLFC
jgi:hypothetical protein